MIVAHTARAPGEEKEEEGKERKAELLQTEMLLPGKQLVKCSGSSGRRDLLVVKCLACCGRAQREYEWWSDLWGFTGFPSKFLPSMAGP